MKQTLRGGRADKKLPKDFDREALKEGQKHEREHTKNKRVAKEIAMDHLAEDPNYYEKLEKLEKQGFAFGFAKMVAVIF